MKKIILAIFLTIICSCTSKPDEPKHETTKAEWVTISTLNSGYKFEAKTGSLDFIQNKEGEYVAVILVRITDPNNSVTFLKNYVTASDCSKKMGKVVSLNLDGSFKFENDFVFGGGTGAANMAEVICGAAAAVAASSSNKSI